MFARTIDIFTYVKYGLIINIIMCFSETLYEKNSRFFIKYFQTLQMNIKKKKTLDFRLYLL